MGMERMVGWRSDSLRAPFVCSLIDSTDCCASCNVLMPGEKISQFARTEILERCKRELESGKGASETLSVVFGEVSQLIDGDDDSTESGSTATVLIIQDHRIVSGFLGDSSACFCNLDAQSQVLDSGFLFEAHRTSNRKEARRILEFGCIIEEGYVVDPENKDNVRFSNWNFEETIVLGCCSVLSFIM